MSKNNTRLDHVISARYHKARATELLNLFNRLNNGNILIFDIGLGSEKSELLIREVVLTSDESKCEILLEFVQKLSEYHVNKMHLAQSNLDDKIK